MEHIKDDYANNCLINAKAVAYIVQNRPEIIGDQAEIDKIVELTGTSLTGACRS